MKCPDCGSFVFEKKIVFLEEIKMNEMTGDIHHEITDEVHFEYYICLDCNMEWEQ